MMYGELTDDGKVIGTFRFRRTTHTGRAGVCSTLSKIGEALTIDVTKWLKNPWIDPSAGSVNDPRSQADGASKADASEAGDDPAGSPASH